MQGVLRHGRCLLQLHRAKYIVGASCGVKVGAGVGEEIERCAYACAKAPAQRGSGEHSARAQTGRWGHAVV